MVDPWTLASLTFPLSVCLWMGVGWALRVKSRSQSVLCYTHQMGRSWVSNSDHWKIQKSNGEVLMPV